jgi:hypothetical protein
MSKSKLQYQTEKIASESGLQTGAQMYFDPIYQNRMEVDFYRRLIDSEKFPLLKIIFSLIFLITVPLIGLSIYFFSIMSNTTLPALLGGVYLLLYVTIAMYIGIKITLASWKQLRVHK